MVPGAVARRSAWRGAADTLEAVKDRAIRAVLDDLGMSGPLAERARATLEQSGLTRPGKQRIAVAKLDAVTVAIDEGYARLCESCSRLPGARARAGIGGGDRELALVDQAHCTRCRGSNNLRAVQAMLEACSRHGVGHLLLVGGSPQIREELGDLAGAIELRMIDGTVTRAAAAARADIVWADVIVVCGSSELAHKVSDLYTRDARSRGKLVKIRRRGIETIATAVVEHLSLRH